MAGLLPDNIGLSARSASHRRQVVRRAIRLDLAARLLQCGLAAIIAASNAFLVSGDASYLDLPRVQIDRVMAQGALKPLRDWTCA